MLLHCQNVAAVTACACVLWICLPAWTAFLLPNCKPVYWSQYLIQPALPASAFGSSCLLPLSKSHKINPHCSSSTISLAKAFKWHKISCVTLVVISQVYMKNVNIQLFLFIGEITIQIHLVIRNPICENILLIYIAVGHSHQFLTFPITVLVLGQLKNMYLL